MSDQVMKARISRMHRRDIAVAWAFVVGLWAAMIFVALAVWDVAPSGLAQGWLMLVGAVVLVFNTAAVLAMLRHYREDRDFMYGLDIRYLDEARLAKGRG